MTILPLLAVAVPIPAKAILTHGSVIGTFDIVNYDPALTYLLTPSAGSASRVGATITLTAADAVCTVVAAHPGGTGAPAASCERKAITQSYNTPSLGPEGDGFYYTSAGDPCSPPVWRLEDISGNGTIWVCRKYELGDDPTPSGYTKSFGEWWKVS